MKNEPLGRKLLVKFLDQRFERRAFKSQTKGSDATLKKLLVAQCRPIFGGRGFHQKRLRSGSLSRSFRRVSEDFCFFVCGSRIFPLKIGMFNLSQIRSRIPGSTYVI